MDFSEVLEKRISCRSYKETPISDDILLKLGDSINLAPTACNLQPFKFLVIRNQEIKQKIYLHYDREWFMQAPCIIVAIGNIELAWKRPISKQSIVETDVAIAFEHLILSATNLGLGTCWICAFNQSALNETLEIHYPYSIFAISPLGYPTNPDQHNRPPRKPIEQIYQIIS